MIRSLCILIFASLFLSSCMENMSNTPSGSGSTPSVSQYATGITDTDRVKLAIDRKTELRTIRK